MSRINNLLNFVCAALEPLRAPDGAPAPSGLAADIRLVDAAFARAINGEAGALALPCLGVAYGGRPQANALDVERERFAGDIQLVVSVLFLELGAVELNIQALHELIDGVIDQLAGRLPAKVSLTWNGSVAAPAIPFQADGATCYRSDASGNLLDASDNPILIAGRPVWKLDLPEPGENYCLLGNALIYAGDQRAPLPEAAIKRGLSLWEIRFRCHTVFTPDRPDLQRDVAMQGADVALDVRPGQTPPTPEGNLFESKEDF